VHTVRNLWNRWHILNIYEVELQKMLDVGRIIRARVRLIKATFWQK